VKLASPSDLNVALRNGLAPVYLVFGDEPLQSAEAGDAIRQAARLAGFIEWELYFVQTGFTWGGLRESADTLSLFGDKRLLDVRFPEKPDREGAEWVAEYLERPSPDCLLLLTAGKLAAEDHKKAWFRAVEQRGVVLQVRPLEGNALLQWLDRRMTAKGLLADQSGLRLLAARVEGNLLAAAQEIEKLAVLCGEGRIEDGQIATAVADAARYDVFDLVDAVLADRFARAQRILEGLKSEGVAPAIVLWALARDARQLATAAFHVAKGESPAAVLMRQKIWESRRNALTEALRRVEVRGWQDALLICARADRIIKGQQQGNPWDALLDICCAMCGRPVAVT
jgi:DNA polymerase-3 subunit delta